MKKIKKDSNPDITLLEICLSMNANSEIREYLADILGSTPIVSAFASEFIKRKEKVNASKKILKKK